MIIISENERYAKKEVGLDYFINNPCEGILTDIILGNKYTGRVIWRWKNKGLFYQFYCNETG